MLPPTVPDSLLILDLRRHRRGPPAVPAGYATAVSSPQPRDCRVDGSLAVLVLADGEDALNDWDDQYHPLCPADFPHLILLDPYDPALARRAMTAGAADCCALDDGERVALALVRIKRDGRPDPLLAQRSTYALRLQAALDTLPTPLFVKDRDCRYIACNRAFEDYLGLPRTRILGATVHDISPPEFATIYQEADRALLAAGGTQVYEAKVRYADGSARDVLFHKAVFRDPWGEADGIAGAMLDISERKQLEQRLETLAATDFLTGAFNLRSFYALAGREQARVTRGAAPFSIIVMDIDRFKDINDRLGHAAGDEALRLIVAAARDQLREQDVFARAGGDEFRILLPETGVEGACQVGERIRQAVAEIEVAGLFDTLRLGISVGTAEFRPGEDTLDSLVVRADMALYRAKSEGRDRVCAGA
jgi:diguanylate cyclase (GGDEF)-like protein/PAS domain S-box-containing protein